MRVRTADRPTVAPTRERRSTAEENAALILFECHHGASMLIVDISHHPTEQPFRGLPVVRRWTDPADNDVTCESSGIQNAVCSENDEWQ